MMMDESTNSVIFSSLFSSSSACAIGEFVRPLVEIEPGE